MDNMELSYQGIKDAIKGELNRIAESFVEIGYRLKQVRDGELYKIDGYSNINEFAKAEYSLSQSTTSRFIAINDSFSLNGSSPKLLEQFEGFGYSKLSEMLTLSEDELKLVTLRTTVAEFREIKQVKKEAENEIYATSHNAESLDITQSEVDYETEAKYIIPEANKLLIEFFRDKNRRQTLKELVMLLSSTVTTETIAKAAEIINPSGHLMHRKGMVIMIFEESHIKYSKFGGATAEYTYSEFIHDLVKVFDMSSSDPWVDFYGESEPEPIPEPKKDIITHKAEPAKEQEKKMTSKQEVKTIAKPIVTQLADDEDDLENDDNEDEEETEELEEENEDDIPGQVVIEDYPELLPEVTEIVTEDTKVTDVVIEHQEITAEDEDSEETVEIVEADIIETQKDSNHCAACSDIGPLMIANATIISVDSKDRVLIAKWEYLGKVREKSIEINYCPVCGKKL